MPVMLTFSKAVENKWAVEEALSLTCSKKVVGAWYWDGDQALWFRPRNYWPQHVKLSFTGHLDGVQISPGVYLTHTLRQSWKIGRSLILVASTSDHHMDVYKDGKRYATWPISTGRPGHDTPNGTYLSIEKANPQHMVGDDYDLQVPHSVRFTWSGDFVHAASWSVGSQGYANVSHGCVNVGPSNAATYYDWSIPGDPVTVTGSPKAGRWDDGYTCWFLSWKELWKGSALDMAVRVGPDGSTVLSIGGMYERRQAGNATQHVFYVAGTDGMLAQVVHDPAPRDLAERPVERLLEPVADHVVEHREERLLRHVIGFAVPWTGYLLAHADLGQIFISALGIHLHLIFCFQPVHHF